MSNALDWLFNSLFVDIKSLKSTKHVRKPLTYMGRPDSFSCLIQSESPKYSSSSLSNASSFSDERQWGEVSELSPPDLAKRYSNHEKNSECRRRNSRNRNSFEEIDNVSEDGHISDEKSEPLQLNATNKPHDDQELCAKRSARTESTERITDGLDQRMFSSGTNSHILFAAGDLSQVNNDTANADNSNLQADGANYVSQTEPLRRRSSYHTQETAESGVKTEPNRPEPFAKRDQVATENSGKERAERPNFPVHIEVAPTVVSEPIYGTSKLRWIDNMEAKNSVLVALTVFYAMVITIFALVFELSHLLAGDSRRSLSVKDLMFGIYMYGASIVFLLYCYIVLLLNPRWKTKVDKAKMLVVRTAKINNTENVLATPSEQSFAITTMTQRKVSHDSPSAGSLFLRLGCVVFGVIGIVYYAFSVFLCSSDNGCHQAVIILDIFAIIFVFTQMHFVFCNWKLSITGSQTIARFGTMHLVATNLWTWIRYILIEESVMDEEIRQVFARDLGDMSHDPNSHDRTIFVAHSSSSTGAVIRSCEGAECVLASMSEIMYTSIVEYSLIGAAVMFIVWRNIDHDRQNVPKEYVKRKHQIRMDCSKTTTGLFFGLAFLAATFTSMAVFSGYTLMGQNQMAATVFGATDIGQYTIASFGCICALWQMRLLRYHSHSGGGGSGSSVAESCSTAKSNHNPSQELLDMILLAFGMTGEMIYSVAGLLGLTGDNEWQALSIILLIVHITRIAQVGLQSCLIYIAGKLRIQGDHRLRQSQPGKQAITFLLLANISMFLMNLLEAEKAGVSETVVNFYGKKSWVFLVRSFSPLTIFYRFHSSVCLAEVWKNAYSWKE
ncbi:otopetrin domain-containing protein [Ditylenchus destructor]|nr:otopetrin domain-containing protein [Ditylenchus destructor]